MYIAIIVVLIGLLIYGLTDKQEKKHVKLDSDLAEDMVQREEDANADIVSYGQVQERKGQLNELIDANLGEHPEQSAQLKDIIEDWANLKIESFENRRSWVRSPGQKKTDD
jgi:FtsZ-interacting cell division protein ZipA|tara:strand:- start:428 stop:760 length:333 start_codon:yes stop_codon:yes gene_type:complete